MPTQDNPFRPSEDGTAVEQAIAELTALGFEQTLETWPTGEGDGLTFEKIDGETRTHKRVDTHGNITDYSPSV